MQAKPIYMVRYSITLAPLTEELCAAGPAPLAQLYAYALALNGLAQRSVRLVYLPLEMGPEKGYFPKTGNCCTSVTPPTRRQKHGWTLRHKASPRPSMRGNDTSGPILG